MSRADSSRAEAARLLTLPVTPFRPSPAPFSAPCGVRGEHLDATSRALAAYLYVIGYFQAGGFRLDPFAGSRGGGWRAHVCKWSGYLLWNMGDSTISGPKLACVACSDCRFRCACGGCPRLQETA